MLAPPTFSTLPYHHGLIPAKKNVEAAATVPSIVAGIPSAATNGYPLFPYGYNRNLGYAGLGAYNGHLFNHPMYGYLHNRGFYRGMLRQPLAPTLSG